MRRCLLSKNVPTMSVTSKSSAASRCRRSLQVRLGRVKIVSSGSPALRRTTFANLALEGFDSIVLAGLVFVIYHWDQVVHVGDVCHG